MFDKCSVNNCRVTGEHGDMGKADAVVIHVQRGVIPIFLVRHPFQRWIFITEESPVNVFSLAYEAPKLSEWAYFFNWTMSYR